MLEHAFYCTRNGMIPGSLCVYESFVAFEPGTNLLDWISLDFRSPEVHKRGIGAYQVMIPVYAVYEAAAILLPRTRLIEDRFSLPSEIKDDWNSLPVWAARGSCATQNKHERAAIGLLQILVRNSPPSTKGTLTPLVGKSSTTRRHRAPTSAPPIASSRAASLPQQSSRRRRRRSAARLASISDYGASPTNEAMPPPT